VLGEEDIELTDDVLREIFKTRFEDPNKKIDFEEYRAMMETLVL